MEVIRDKDGNIIRRSKNLRGVLEYARTHIISKIGADRIGKEEGKLMVLFHDGASYETNFASFGALKQWIRARRGWYGLPLTVNGRQITWTDTVVTW